MGFHTVVLVTTFQTPPDLQKLVEKDKHGPSAQQPEIPDFYPGGYSAKVQLPHHTMPGMIPRKIEIERYVCIKVTKKRATINRILQFFAFYTEVYVGSDSTESVSVNELLLAYTSSIYLRL